MADRWELRTDVVDAIDAMDWSQLEFGYAPDSEEMADVVMPIVWQAALDFIYEQPMTLTRDTLTERWKQRLVRRWKGRRR